MDRVKESDCEEIFNPFSLVFVLSDATFTCYSQAAPSMVGWSCFLFHNQMSGSSFLTL